ncbi:hypothetical protein RB594_004632 [Gaeumannomyces avenae]
MANNMRLRLVVRRHGLPDTRVLFSISLDGDPTIAYFLELVNATVPLESDDWGLDDYAVELRNPAGGAFEALHFQTVASILQQDEEVYIRPLLTPDLKKRHVSGRHQISSDGKHLVDGVPFGRPLLRQPRDRPAIKIPPRKRRRILAEDPDSPAAEDDWDDEDEDEDFQPLQLTQNGEPPSYLGNEEQQDDSSSADGDENDMDLDDDVSEIDEDELSTILLDNDEDAGQDLAPALLAPSDEQGQPAENAKTETDNESDSDQPAEDAKTETDNESDSDPAIVDLKSSMAVAFPDAPQATLDRAFRKCHARNGTYVARKIFKWLKKRHVPQLSYHRVKRHYRTKVGDVAVSALTQDVDMHEPDADSADSLTHYRDQHERSRPQAFSELLLHDDEDEYADDESDYASTGGENHESKTDSEGESEVDAHETPSGSPAATGQPAQLESGADSESGSDGPADSDDGESSDSSTHDNHEGDSSEDKGEAAARARLPSSDVAASDDKSGGDSSASSDDLDSDDSVDGQAAAIQSPASDGGSGENQSSSDDSSSAESSSSSAESSSEDEESDSDGDGEGEGESSDDEQPEEMSTRPPTSAPATAAGPSSSQQPVAGSVAPVEDEAGEREPHVAAGQGKTKTRNRNARRRRAKSLLLQNSILEERKNALLAAIGCGPESPSPLPPVTGPGESPSMEPAAAAPGLGPASSDSGDDVDDLWSTKINYQGTECAAEEMVLSQPPFPFVQRWDPSQRSRRKRKQRHNVDERPEKKPRFADAPEEAVETLNYDDVDTGDKDADVAHETSYDDSQMTDWDDLPSLPTDLTTLPPFHLSDARVSMTVTWKKWLLSEATKWQPQIVDVTAVIGRINENGHTLDVMMAKRDRAQFSSAKQFDEDTGQRIYRKFEPPDLSDDEICPDAEQFWAEGWDTITFEDMIEPRILQAPLPSFDDKPTTLNSHDLVHKSTNLRISEHVDSSVVVPDSQALRSVGDTTKGKSATHGQPDKEPEQGIKSLDSCVPDTNQDIVTGPSASRSPHAAQVPSDGDALVMDDELMASHYSANTAAAKTNALIGGLVLGQYSFPPGQPADDSDSPSRQLTGNAAPIPAGDVAPDQVSYPQLHVPSSSIGSVRSGRQPDADDNIDMAQDAFSNAVDTDDENEDQVETPRASRISEHEADQVPQTPSKLDNNAVGSAPSSSSSSLPSISTLWFTCSTSRNTQSPSRTTQQSILGAKSAQAVKGNAEYEEAMRRLDAFSDEDDADENALRAEQDKAPSLIKQSKSQPLASIETSQRPQQVKTEKVKAEPSSIATAVSPPSHSARGAIKGALFSTSAAKKAAPSQPPPDAEIILLSSSSEPVFEEDYAEDELDEDYEASTSQRSSARNTPGYATATRKTFSRQPRADLGGASAPVRARSAVSVLGGISRGSRRVSSMAPPPSSSS